MSRDTKRQLVQEIGLLSREQQNLVDRVDDGVANLMGVNRTDMRCIDILGRMGPMTAGQLAVESGLTTGAVTTMIDRIEGAGWARRVSDPSDRRRVVVEATPKVAEGAFQVYAPVFDLLKEMEEKYTVQELEAILRFMRQGNETNRRQIEYIAGLPGLARDRKGMDESKRTRRAARRGRKSGG